MSKFKFQLLNSPTFKISAMPKPLKRRKPRTIITINGVVTTPELVLNHRESY